MIDDRDNNWYEISKSLYGFTREVNFEDVSDEDTLTEELNNNEDNSITDEG